MSQTQDKPVRGQAQSVRQLARRAALDAQAKIREQRVAREKRLSARGVEVMVALGERDELVRRYEQRAGEALLAMTSAEGLSVDEAIQWCGEGLSRREVARLCALADSDGSTASDEDRAD
ncbi:hypothetical protein [Knoellia koreensis]|jgi:hypothetical protein|uniref:Uncharacterized protein n=1 Tax=Knoellia koreensis TaxID=2730921 RepID=A0A849HG82_9MICO|nr:hypothetical protein [Knoellia sp. DB2414S]NNM46955.1 hypothetical protein [Knoellia sp. DB2414S]